MRPIVVLSLLACSLFSTPAFAAWDIFQSYVIIDAGSGNQFLAGGYNADAATAFDGSDLGTFAASDALTLNGGELKTYKNGTSNVCGGNVYYRVYASGDTPGSFSSVALTNVSNLTNPGDQKWDETAAGVDLLAGLTAGGAYTLEVYWDLTGADSDIAGCGETKYDSDFGNNFTAAFTFNVPGCTDPDYAEYDANANTDDGSCTTFIDPCDGALVLGSVSVTSVPTAIDAADGAIAIDVTTGTATALDLTGINGAGDYNFSLPGAMDGILPGTYDANAEDAGGCNSNTISLIVPYAQCCDGCGVYDVDTDGICDDSDNCIDRTAPNYNDPANGTCIIPGCTDPDYFEYVANADQDDGSCSTLIVAGCMDPGADNYNAAANTDDGSCITSGCMDPAFEEYNPDANTDDGSCSTLAYCSPVDMDGITYDVVEIDDQCWFTFNLRSSVYADGTPIPYVGWEPSGPMPESVLNADTPGDLEWANDTEGGQCVNLHVNVDSDGNWYDQSNPDFACENYPDSNLPPFCCTMCAYGRLYNHHAVMNASGLCPTDWHVPTDDDWTQLTDYVASQGFAGNEGKALKGSESAHWTNNTGPTAGTDDFGLALTGMSSRLFTGQFSGNAAEWGRYWSSTISSTTAGPPSAGGLAWARTFRTSETDFDAGFLPRTMGNYVRCIKDAQD